MASQLTKGLYEKHGVQYATLTLTDGGCALTVTPEGGGPTPSCFGHRP